MRETSRATRPIQPRPADIPQAQTRPPRETSARPPSAPVKDSLSRNLEVRRPDIPKLPTLKPDSAFHEVGKKLLNEHVSSKDLQSIKSHVETLNKNRGWFTRFLDNFGSADGKALTSLRSHIEQRLSRVVELEARHKTEKEATKNTAASEIAKDLVSRFNGDTSAVASELLARAKMANANSDKEGFAVALRALALLSHSPETETSKAAISALQEVQKLPSLKRSSSQRTPSEILVNLAAQLEKLDSRAFTPKQKLLMQELQLELKSAFTSHKMNVEQTRSLLTGLTKRLKAEGLSHVSEGIGELLKQLPSRTQDVALTRLHDNIYGRVYDSSLIAHLVNDPPPGVKEAMTKSGQLLANWMSDPSKISADDLNAAAKKTQEYLKDVDPRFWFKKAPGIEKVRDAKTPEEAKAALLEFLRSPKESGEEAIAVPYLTVKLSIILRELATARARREAEEKGKSPGSQTYDQYVKQHTYDYTPWMSEADRNYNIVGVQANRDGGMKPATKMAAAGITLQHQPAAVAEDWMTPSLRPATLYRPKLGDQTSEATHLALSQGIPFAGGVSGSTNINLHFLDYMAKHNPAGKDIDPKNYFLGNTMFLVHDGGHSIHEALWVANQTQPKMALGIGRGDPSQPNRFITNIQDLVDTHQGESKQRLESAASRAWTDTTNYFNKNSAFRSK